MAAFFIAIVSKNPYIYPRKKCFNNVSIFLDVKGCVFDHSRDHNKVAENEADNKILG